MALRPTGPGGQHKVLILDDHPMTRYGIVRLIEQEADLTVVGEAQDAQQALAAVEKCRPAIILVDLTLPGREGLEFIKDMRAMYPDVAVLVVSMHEEDLYAERALRAGARGYIMKSQGGGKLVEAIRQVLRGKVYLSEKMSEKALETLAGKQRHRSDCASLAQLSDREFEIFRLVGRGLTTREISQQLHLSVKTVETHRLHAREKLEVRTGAALTKYAIHWMSTQGSR